MSIALSTPFVLVGFQMGDSTWGAVAHILRCCGATSFRSDFRCVADCRSGRRCTEGPELYLNPNPSGRPCCIPMSSTEISTLVWTEPGWTGQPMVPSAPCWTGSASVTADSPVSLPFGARMLDTVGCVPWGAVQCPGFSGESYANGIEMSTLAAVASPPVLAVSRLFDGI